jgi:hypothetical protein
VVRSTVVPASAIWRTSSHLAPAARVHARGGLVEEQRIGGHDQAGPDVQPAAHPARVAAHRTAGRAGQIEGGEQLIGSPLAGGAGQAAQAAEDGQVLISRQVSRAITGHSVL